MLIRAYGTFWNRDDVEWMPGAGRPMRLVGRRGLNSPGVRVVDFRHQQGLYILYGDYGPYYVGLTRKQGIGKRLKDHTGDRHQDKWTRFSWFGFCTVLARKDHAGLNELKTLPMGAAISPTVAIAEMEALLIYSMGCAGNERKMQFPKAKEWEQVSHMDEDFYPGR